ncbi:MAG: ABC transporter substrate-binding protein [Clostridiales bacterium]|jgi:raffinose/stachyose/melibiose transport system substrate-binding protein|nr:ABC transporter substrate-binding protein [Clostridiales bacterium]
MKKLLAILLSLACVFTALTGCTSGNTTPTAEPITAAPAADPTQAPVQEPAASEIVVEEPVAASVTINTFSTYAGSDGNAQNYQDALKAWQDKTGNKVSDTSATSDENLKSRIRTDFSTGSEPDALFYFTGADADTFLDKVVSVADVRKEFPDYASNMKDDAVAFATDGNWYAIPVNGYWENFFVNKTVLEAAGVAVPGPEYSWDQFLSDCQKIKDAGYTPVTASFVDVPHYWWEFAIFNNTSPKTHGNIPKAADDDAAKAWIAGMNDIKQVYDLGYFPENSLSDKYESLQELFYTDKAAFMLDGSWTANAVKTRCSDDAGNINPDLIKNYTVCNFPSKTADRKSTDMIGGMSSGWYITQKAWNDPAKKAAVVDFISFMTSDEEVSRFTGTGSSALKNGVTLDSSSLSSLDNDIIASMVSATTYTPAVQDAVAGDARNAMFQAVPQMLAGAVTPEQLIDDFIKTFPQ